MRRTTTLLVLSGALAAAATVTMLSLAAGAVAPRPGRTDGIDEFVLAAIDEMATAVDRDADDPAAWERLGMVYHANQLPTLAAECYAAAVEFDPRRARTWRLLALLAGERGERQAAIAHARRAIAANPDDGPSNWQLGNWLFEERDLDGAFSRFEASTRLDPTDAGGWLGLVRTHLAAGRVGAATAVVDSRLRDGRYEDFARRLLTAGKRSLDQPAAERIDALLAVGTPALADTLVADLQRYRVGLAAELERARELAAAERFDEALELVARMRRARPKDARVLNQLGEIELARRRPEVARTCFREAIAVDPDHGPARFNLAMQLAQAAGDNLGQSDELLLHARQAARLLPNNSRAHGLLGIVLADRNELEQAKSAFERAAELDPDNPAYRVDLVRTLLRTRRFAEAVTQSNQLVARYPRDPTGWQLLMGAHSGLGAWDRAEQALRQLEAIIGPGSPQATQLRAQLQRLRAAAGKR